MRNFTRDNYNLGKSNLGAQIRRLTDDCDKGNKGRINENTILRDDVIEIYAHFLLYVDICQNILERQEK